MIELKEGQSFDDLASEAMESLLKEKKKLRKLQKSLSEVQSYFVYDFDSEEKCAFSKVKKYIAFYLLLLRTSNVDFGFHDT